LPSVTKKGVWFAASAVVLSIAAAPFALAAGEGGPLRGGSRSPSSNPSLAYKRETQVIADTSTYGTRQSNKSDNGGGAIYGCRSGAGGTAKGMEPCVRASNLSTGRAFEFSTLHGSEAGRIEAAGGDNAKPFTTNATGVADGLNADRVDGRHASEIVAAAQALNSFAQVSATGVLGAQRGVASAAHVGATGSGTYTVVFASDVSKCALAAVESQYNADNGAVAVELGPDGKTLQVRTRNGGGPDGTGPTDPADHPFHVTAVC
jgi:hypothetical protein